MQRPAHVVRSGATRIWPALLKPLKAWSAVVISTRKRITPSMMERLFI
jgi:hypothetical protein